MRKTVVFSVCVISAFTFSFSAKADSAGTRDAEYAALSSDIQKDIDSSKTIENLKDAFTTIPKLEIHGTTSALSSEKVLQGTEMIAQYLSPFVRADQTLTRLNDEIKQTIGIDMPVFLKAILKGVLWLIWFIIGLIQRLIS